MRIVGGRGQMTSKKRKWTRSKQIVEFMGNKEEKERDRKRQKERQRER